MKQKLMVLFCSLLLCLCFGACTETSNFKPEEVETSGNPSASTSTSTSVQEEYVLQFDLAIEIDGATLYLAVEGLSTPNDVEPYIHTIANKIVQEGDALSFLKNPTILNDKNARYYFDGWDASDGENVVRVMKDTVLSQTVLKKGTITVRPTVKKVAHTNNYS